MLIRSDSYAQTITHCATTTDPAVVTPRSARATRRPRAQGMASSAAKDVGLVESSSDMRLVGGERLCFDGSPMVPGVHTKQRTDGDMTGVSTVAGADV